jgi:hypothetical protein
MNDLNTRLLEYLPDPNTVKGGIGSIVETLQTEAPLLVGEVMKWHFTISVIVSLVGILLIISGIALMLTTFKVATARMKDLIERNQYYEAGIRWFTLLFLVVSGIGVLIMSLHLTWLQILIAPRLFLLEYISNLL